MYPPVQPGDPDWRDYYSELNLPNRYHNGGIWPFIGGFYVAALVKAGKFDEAQSALDRLVRLNRDGEFNEWHHGATGGTVGRARSGVVGGHADLCLRMRQRGTGVAAVIVRAATHDDLRDGAAMRHIVRAAFVLVQYLPSLEIAPQLPRPEAVCGRFFAGLGHMDNRQQDSSGLHARLSRLEKVPLQVVGDDDQVPCRFGYREFASLEIRHDRIHAQPLRCRPFTEYLDRGIGAVDGGHRPAMCGQP